MTTKKYYVLKWIAILSMLTDHIAIVLSEGISNDNYIIMRTIGRLAFPLFCYMTAESFYFTTSPKRHLLRLLLLAIISEIPYNYIICGTWSDFSSQNVIFTLALGFFSLFITKDKIDNIIFKSENTKRKSFLVAMLWFDLIGTMMVLSIVCHFLYIWEGIMLIVIFGKTKERKRKLLWRTIALVLFIAAEKNPFTLVCVLALGLMHWAEKETDETKIPDLTGTVSKQICRWFYPAHLAVLSVVKLWMTRE